MSERECKHSCTDCQEPCQSWFPSLAAPAFPAELVPVVGSPSLDSSSETTSHKVLTLYCQRCGHKHQVKMRCGDRCCPECRARDYFRLLKGYLDAVKAIHRPKLLTLTLRNLPELTPAAYRFVRRCFVRLMRRKYYRDHVRGGLATLETTNVGKGWHIHLHVLLDAEYLPQRRISEDWAKLTGGSPIVDIRACGTVGDALSYCLKYLSKAPKLQGKREVLTRGELEARREVYRAAVKGVRLVQPFGSLFGQLVLELPHVPCPDCGNTKWLCWDFELLFQWHQYLDDKKGGTLGGAGDEAA